MKARGDFEKYYLHQVGQGMPVYTGAAMQRGHGIGKVLRPLLRMATPLIRAVGTHALKRSKNPMVREMGTWALNKGIEAIAGEPKKPTRRQPRPAPKKKKQGRAPPQRKPRKTSPKTQDIFT